MSHPDFFDQVHQGDTLKRSIQLRNRDTGLLENLSGYQLTYGARLQGKTGSMALSGSANGGSNDTKITASVAVPANATPGLYDAWLRVSSPGGQLVMTEQGALEVRLKPS